MRRSLGRTFFRPEGTPWRFTLVPSFLSVLLGTAWHFFYKNMAGLLAKSKTDKSDDCSLESKKPDLNVLQEAKQTEFLNS